ncbi:MAG: hypothetical protein WD768_09425 [Phycisphaeraceae bacterium]
MKQVLEIPIKARSSTRVPNKNFRDLAGKPLCFWMLDELAKEMAADCQMYIDSEAESVMEPIRKRFGDRFLFHKRDEWFAGDQANGNHLLSQFVHRHPEFDVYAQVFITSVTLPGRLVREAMDEFCDRLDQHDSITLVTEDCGWYWYQGKAVNYRPDIPDGLPRSQDAMMLKETTGLYAITREAVLRTGCRLGHRPLFYKVEREFAMDIDTMDDFAAAQKLLEGRM